ncbi:MAG: MBL fold hydrolase [Candidatus Binatia bacterium]|nr:MAG: MBL fold hydrolase [Candidatus Binatia bacterium]
MNGAGGPPRPSVPILRFWGATETVTGSRFLIDTPRARVLVDCGLFQGLKQLRLRNWAGLPIPPETIDAVVLSHAHLDHSGYLPAIVRDGFRGPIFSTPYTKTLCEIVLPDSGRVQEEDAAYANRKGFSKHHPALPLYTEEDAVRSLARFRTVEFQSLQEVAPEVGVVFHRAGHILGSAIVELRLGGMRGRVVVFSGDLGRPWHPVLRPPEPRPSCDILLVESTYGDRRHEDVRSLERFRDAIRRTAERGGMVVIPSFAVDRTEVVLYHLRALMQAGEVPQLPVWVDSPMAISTLRVYRAALEQRNHEVHAALVGSDPFDPGQLIEARTMEESRAINSQPGPGIIISASGMATGGRVLHHLLQRLPDARNTVVLVGYQAEGTRGRALLEGAREIKLLGRYVAVRAEIVDVPAFSVHADREELLAWVGANPHAPEVTYIVHGEPMASQGLRAAVEEKFGWSAVVPRYQESVRLD